MGGMGGIFYTAISRYARDHFVQTDHFRTFLALIRALDTEYLAWVRDTREAEEEERKRKQKDH